MKMVFKILTITEVAYDRLIQFGELYSKHLVLMPPTVTWLYGKKKLLF